MMPIRFTSFALAKMCLLVGCLLTQHVSSCPSILNPAVVAASVGEERRLRSMLDDDVDISAAPSLQGRRLQGLAGSPTLNNNAFMNDGGTTLTNKDGSSKTTFDVMAELADTHSEDMCIFSMQQFPPPGADYDSATSDFDKFKEYGDLAAERIQALSGANINGGSVLHGAAILGYEGNQKLCSAGVDSANRCEPKRQNQKLKWAHAATIFKIKQNSSNLATALQTLETWRNSEQGHLNNIRWVYNGGNPANGGSNVAGWGQNGGIRAKIVPCCQIDSKFHYPSQVGTVWSDPITQDGTLWSDELYDEWVSLCSIWPETDAGSCSTTCPTTTTTTTTSTPTTTTLNTSTSTNTGNNPQTLLQQQWQDRFQCADGSQPTCPDGSAPTYENSGLPTCATGGEPLCQDGSSPQPPRDQIQEERKEPFHGIRLAIVGVGACGILILASICYYFRSSQKLVMPANLPQLSHTNALAVAQPVAAAVAQPMERGNTIQAMTCTVVSGTPPAGIDSSVVGANEMVGEIV